MFNKLALTKARLSNRCSWDGSRRRFDTIPETVSYASCDTCDRQISSPSSLEDHLISPNSHLPQADHLPYSFLKSLTPLTYPATFLFLNAMKSISQTGKYLRVLSETDGKFSKRIDKNSIRLVREKKRY